MGVWRGPRSICENGVETKNPEKKTARVGRVAWRILFGIFWVVFSKRTILLKMLSGRVRSKTCPSHQQQLRDCRCILAWHGASTMPIRQPKSVPASMLWRRLQAQTFSIDKSQPVLGGLTSGFVGRFSSGLLGLAGGFRGGRAPADFFIFGWRFPAVFSFVFCDQKSTSKIHHFHGGLLEDFPP